MYGSTTTVLLCFGLLVLSPESMQNEISEIGLTIPKHLHTDEAVGGNGNINNRSLSAWSWTPHFNSQRNPWVIFEAECQTQYCTDPNNKLQTELNSVPIYHYILVLHKQDNNCFTASYQKVAVGCTCVWAKIS